MKGRVVITSQVKASKIAQITFEDDSIRVARIVGELKPYDVNKGEPGIALISHENLVRIITALNTTPIPQIVAHFADRLCDASRNQDRERSNDPITIREYIDLLTQELEQITFMADCNDFVMECDEAERKEL